LEEKSGEMDRKSKLEEKSKLKNEKRKGDVGEKWADRSDGKKIGEAKEWINM
jgi:hypothetical protein